jgi:CheY-like chemotaxis protein
MKAPCEALILEDDPEQLAGVAQAMREVHLEPLPTTSPDRALNKLRYYQPVLAVVDLDMSMAPESEHTVADLLQALYERCGGCFVLVYSVRADEIEERKRIERIHPMAMFVSKLDGQAALIERIRRMMGVHFGDLLVRRGMTFHEPSGETFGHRVAVSLVLGAALGQEVLLDDTEAKAARRMRTWLKRVGSPVEIVDLGHRSYTLEVRQQAESPAASGEA